MTKVTKTAMKVLAVISAFTLGWVLIGAPLAYCLVVEYLFDPNPPIWASAAILVLIYPFWAVFPNQGIVFLLNGMLWGVVVSIVSTFIWPAIRDHLPRLGGRFRQHSGSLPH